MICSTIGGASRTRGAGEELRWRSLARRGMLFGECESFDYVRLPPGTVFALRGREGTESAWFALSGSGWLLGMDPAAQERTFTAGELLLLPAGRQEELQLASGAAGLELLWLSVLPQETTHALPPRRPVA